MSQEIPIDVGRRVTMHFTLALEDGFEAETTRNESPLSFTVGEGDLFPALEHRLIGLVAGQERTFTIQPEEGFGYRDADNVHIMARSEFSGELSLEPGTVIGFTTPSGEEVAGTVVAADDEAVRVDFNHPLAGHVLTFTVQILSVE